MRELPVPSYLPDPARYVVPWARAKVLEVAARNRDVDLGDLWDEAVAALVRACTYFDPETNRGAVTARFADYAKTAVVRGLWRYALSNLVDGQHRRRRRREWVELDERTAVVASAEDEYAGLEVARQRLGGIADAVCQTTPRAISGCRRVARAVPIRKARKPPTKAAPPPPSSRSSGPAATVPTPASRRSPEGESAWPIPMATRR